ncbi:MAG: hypothetical protein HFE45_08535 [Oscillospiraceae bacterium]|nr:hypothetical protein [Oscillospiraceae bacterium]
MIYFRLVVINLKSAMEHRISFFMTIIGQFITAFTFLFGLSFLLDQVDAIDGFTRGQVFLCFAVVMMAFSLGEMFGGGLAVFSRMLATGSFDRVLLRPRNALLQVLASGMDSSRLGLTAQAALVLMVALPQSGICWGWQKILTLTLMVLCGAALFFSIFMIQAALSFFALASLNFMNVFTYGARSFGKYPFSVYGKGVLCILTFVLPMAWFQYYPFLFLLDRTVNPLWMLSPLAALLFLVPAAFLFRFGLRHHQSVG